MIRVIRKDYNERSLGREGNDISLELLVDMFRGKRVWNQLNKRDWLIWSNSLYAPNLIIIGGYEGNSTDCFVKRIKSVKTIHVYEPVPEFFSSIQASYLRSPVVTAHNEAIYDGQVLNLDLSGDASLINLTGRSIPQNRAKNTTLSVKSITPEEAVERILNKGSDDQFSLYMNCEGSEYYILQRMLSKGIFPQSIIVQTHTTGFESYPNLYSLRASLAEKYFPIMTADWAWDVWVRNDYVKKNAASIEQDFL